MNFPTVAEWVAHPDALDRLQDTMARAGAHYDALPDETARRTYTHDERTYRLAERGRLAAQRPAPARPVLSDPDTWPVPLTTCARPDLGWHVATSAPFIAWRAA